MCQQRVTGCEGTGVCARVCVGLCVHTACLAGWPSPVLWGRQGTLLTRERAGGQWGGDQTVSIAGGAERRVCSRVGRRPFPSEQHVNCLLTRFLGGSPC